MKNKMVKEFIKIIPKNLNGEKSIKWDLSL